MHSVLIPAIRHTQKTVLAFSGQRVILQMLLFEKAKAALLFTDLARRILVFILIFW